jgi:hypothetical protein
MQKIATADQVEAELRTLLAYAESPQPSRAKLAASLFDLSQRIAGRAFIDDWKYNFIGGQAQVTLMVSVIAAESNGWRAELGISEGGKVIDHGAMQSEWSRSFEGAVSVAKTMAKKAKIKWSPKHYSTDKDHKPGDPPPTESKV